MSIKNIAVAVTVALATTGLAGGLAHADPVPASADALPDAVRGVEHGVAFEVVKSADGNSLSANLFGGTFTLTDGALNVVDAAGTVVASAPLVVELAEGTVELRPRLDATGTHLTAAPFGYWQQSSPKERSMWAGAALGGFIGAVLGMAIGIIGGPLVFVTFLGGALIGGLIGAGIGAAIPNSDVPDRWDYVVPAPSSPVPGSWEDCHGGNHTGICN